MFWGGGGSFLFFVLFYFCLFSFYLFLYKMLSTVDLIAIQFSLSKRKVLDWVYRMEAKLGINV